MSSLAEIEAAADALPPEQKQQLMLFLATRLKPLGVKVTQIAHGLPAGGDLDYADQATLISAMQWRREM